ncbi:ring-cleaving dioxygenase [Alkalicoccus urumqiensis]|uniref:ring-cleaving dioxygenase n=1 Tax=Alkalicoccus urumqiensis TaxID=1548213 RepID=UPI001FE02B72|nr:ring-cleaving dioxygenase [Alkalicoccus urumqiensis]
MEPITGIHHVSSITADASKNYHFYTSVLGMRLVKKTVNQDDPGMYHLFFADAEGTPGTDFTFFEIPMAGRTYPGSGSISRTSLRVPDDLAVSFWEERLKQYDAALVESRETLNGHDSLLFHDPEGQRIAIISDADNAGIRPGTPWSGTDVPEEAAILGLGPAHLHVKRRSKTAYVLTEVLGFSESGTYSCSLGEAQVFTASGGGSAAEVHVFETEERAEKPGRGSVHHVAFRVPDREALEYWAHRIDGAGYMNSGIVERYYFQSLYFREPNGILYELATDGPGFQADEPLDSLGERLALPPFLEPEREAIEKKLKPLSTY